MVSLLTRVGIGGLGFQNDSSQVRGQTLRGPRKKGKGVVKSRQLGW